MASARDLSCVALAAVFADAHHEHSCRIPPSCYPGLMRHWFNRVSRFGLHWGTSFDLDFHTIPFHGDDALIEKHYVSKRSRQQKGILAFLAQDADTRVFCYANAELRKDQWMMRSSALSSSGSSGLAACPKS